MSAGISGSNFWIPIYFIWLGIDAKTSFWLALLTMLFGFGSGIVRNVKNKTIQWTIVKQYLKIAVPFVILGTLLVPFVPAEFLLSLFGSFVILYGVFLIYRFGLFYRRDEGAQESGEKIYWTWAALAGFFKGLIATGTGKIIMPCVAQALQNQNSRRRYRLNGGHHLCGKSVCRPFPLNTRFYLDPHRTGRFDRE
jgi:uncharacterized membrane protein YfcA